MTAAPTDLKADPLDSAYSTWSQDKTPENLNRVVRHLRPTISHGLYAVGALEDPAMRGEAHFLAAESVQKFDPAAGAGLRTYVSSNLRGLSRIKRKFSSTLSLPERTQLDAMALERGRRELEDKNGSEPDALMLADHTGIPVTRIADIRKSMRLAPSESALAQESASHAVPDYFQEALEYVIPTLDATDRRIAEMKLGWAGHAVYPPKDIATQLRITPVELSRRSARLALKLSQLSDDLQKAYAT